MKDEKRTCGDCEKRLTEDCPRYEYKNYEDNLIACPETAEACEKFKQKEKKVVVRVPCLITDELIAEEVWDPPKPPKFVVRHFDKEELSYATEIDLGEEDLKGRRIVYQPLYNAHLRKGMVVLPRKPQPCTIKEVIKEAIEFVLNGFDPCGKENEVKLLCLSAISSWILDKEKPILKIAGIGVFAPILAIRGPSGSGKNRLGNLLRFLSYHPFFDVSTYRIPSLYRPLDMWKGTLVLDEGDLKGTGETSQLIHFLNSRATGTPIGRQNPDRPSKCDAFESFGLTIIAQRRHFEDNATEGRSLPFYADVSEKQLPTLETEEMIQKGMEFQDKLLYIRLKHWKDIEIEKTRWIEGVSDHRVNSALLPIVALAKFDPELEEFTKKIVAPLERARCKLKAESDDGVIVNALWDRINSNLWGIHNELYYVGESRDKHKGVSGEEIEVVKPLTASKLGESLRRTSENVRKILTSLNITPENAPARFRVGRFNLRGILFDPYKLEKRLRDFVIDYPKHELFKVLGLPVPSVPSVPGFPSGADKKLGEFGENLPEKKPGTPGTPGTSDIDKLVKEEFPGLSEKEAEVVSKLKGEWTEDLTQEEILNRLVKSGLSRLEATDLFEKLGGPYLRWCDKDGKTVWKWCFKS